MSAEYYDAVEPPVRYGSGIIIKFGRASAKIIKSVKKIEYQNTDRIEEECEFSIEKRCYGLGKLVVKLK